MADQILKDAKGRTIGRIVTDKNGRQRIKNKQGHTLGSYDPKFNKTRDKRGNTVGKGNLLTSLL